MENDSRIHLDRTGAGCPASSFSFKSFRAWMGKPELEFTHGYVTESDVSSLIRKTLLFVF